MAMLVTINVLVDSVDDADATDGINALLQAAQHPDEGVESNIIDWEISDVLPVVDELKDSICNETYAEGDAFQHWVVYSPSEAAASEDKAGFWSNTYGWTTYDLATRFEPVFNRPRAAGDDAIWMLESKGLESLQSSC